MAMRLSTSTLVPLASICLLGGPSRRANADQAATPRVFGEGVISTGHEFTVTFTADGREVYFTRADTVAKRLHILHSVRHDRVWQAATPVSFAKAEWSDLDPALSPDGRRLYFVSTRPRPGRASGPADNMDIWYADRVGESWGEPQWIDAVNSDAKEGSPTVDRDGSLCFFSDRGAEHDHNAIYCSRPSSGGYATPVRQDTTINAGPSDTSPWLAPDGRTILFYSTRPGGFGKADLYVATMHDGTWGAAKNLGPAVNTSDFEYNPSVSPDGRTLYFGRRGKVWEIPIPALDSRVIYEGMFR
jgi:Tol biopolymer transport system component